jgi:hypothetical protein
MGWRFRRSINIGPLRVNLSKRGIGMSVGAGPVRVGRSARGKTYASTSIPGTGVSYRHDSTPRRPKGPGGCFTLVVLSITGTAATALSII